MAQRRQNKGSSTGEGRYAYEGLDRVMHEKARLGILASLAANAGGLLFNDLKQLCSLTDGNLSRHLTALEKAKAINIKKRFVGSRPQTRVSLSARGRDDFMTYLQALEDVLLDVVSKTSTGKRKRLSIPSILGVVKTT